MNKAQPGTAAMAIRMPEEWRKKLKILAARRGVTIGQLVTYILTEYFIRNKIEI